MSWQPNFFHLVIFSSLSYVQYNCYMTYSNYCKVCYLYAVLYCFTLFNEVIAFRKSVTKSQARITKFCLPTHLLPSFFFFLPSSFLFSLLEVWYLGWSQIHPRFLQWEGGGGPEVMVVMFWHRYWPCRPAQQLLQGSGLPLSHNLQYLKLLIANEKKVFFWGGKKKSSD